MSAASGKLEPDDRTAPRVSVLMPLFNAERFVGEAVTSVLASTFTDFELLVLDDGSTDTSVAQAEWAAHGDARVRIFRLPHAGVGATRNAGLRRARGSLIANLDADDRMFPRRIERQVAFLDRNPACVGVGTRLLLIDARGTPLQIGIRCYSHEEIDRAHMEGRAGAIGNPMSMFRKASALSIGGYSDELRTVGEDYDFWLRLAEVGRLANLPDVLTCYRVHDSNVSLAELKEDRLRRSLVILALAFERRGVVDRVPTKTKAPPKRVWEHFSDEALVRYYSGRRGQAMLRALVGSVLKPTSPVVRSALRTIWFDAAPTWPTVAMREVATVNLVTGDQAVYRADTPSRPSSTTAP